MLNPILASSALRRMRSARTMLILCAYVGVLMGLLCLGMFSFVFEETVYIDSMTCGMTSYRMLMIAQFALIVLVAPAMTASSIAGERERQTLELLLVTNTGSLRIVFGKLMESLAFLALLMIAGFPVMCLTTLLGGVSLIDIANGMLFLLTCAFAAASIGVFSSSFSKNTVSATIVSYLMILAIGVAMILPMVFCMDQAELADVIYSDSAHAALTEQGILLLSNPLVGLYALFERNAMLPSTTYLYSGQSCGALSLMEMIGYDRVLILNMASAIVSGLALVLIASRLVRPKNRRVRRKA